MHRRNGDQPYNYATDAMRFWPETATAVAVRLAVDGTLELAAPLGLKDLFALRLAPTERFEVAKRQIFEARLAQKQWLSKYPLIRT